MSSPAGASPGDPGHRDLRVVVQNARGHAAKISKGADVAFEKSFGRLRRKRRHETVVGVGQVHRQVVRLPLHSGDHHQRLAEVCLRFPRSMHQWHEHLPGPQSMSANIVLHDGVAAGERVLGPQPLKDHASPSVLPLLPRPPLVVFQNRVDRAQPRTQLPGRASPAAGAGTQGGHRVAASIFRTVSRDIPNSRATARSLLPSTRTARRTRP